MDFDDVKVTILAFIICFPVAFLVSWGVVEGWVLFWEYGHIWNETTVPPLVIWDIFFDNIDTIFYSACIITPIVLILIAVGGHYA